MQKFVIKKISRSTNITLTSTEEQNLMQCSDKQPQRQLKTDDDENLEISSIKMCGYLKKKRNFGGWSKLYFVLQNSLLMSYNSKDEYEKKLVSFKDVICLIPSHTILLPSLEPRFTIASNLNTFYTFRCDDNKTCSKWITAILECLSRDINMEFTGKKSTDSVKNFCSQQNLNDSCSHRSKFVKRPTNHSWENLQGSSNNTHSNWIVNHNGRILLELNMINCNRAKIPIATQTAKILKNCTDNDVIRTTKKINFIQNDENQNLIHNGNHHHHEMKVAHDTHFEKPDQFRLHNGSARKQSKEVNRISRMFPSAAHSKMKMFSESESQRPENLTQKLNGTEIGTEEQEQAMSFGEEFSFFNTGDYASVDSTQFNNKLNIENTYSDINLNPNGRYKIINECEYAIPDLSKKSKWIKSNEPENLPEYSIVNLSKKYEGRLKKAKQKEINQNVDDDVEKVNNLIKNLNIYEEIGNAKNNDETNIYELIDIPQIKSTRKSRSLIFLRKNWSRIHIFDFAKRFKDSSNDTSSKSSSGDSETIRKREKQSLTLSDFSKHFNYRSMRNKAKKIYRKSNSTSAIPSSSNFDVVSSSTSSIDDKKRF